VPEHGHFEDAELDEVSVLDPGFPGDSLTVQEGSVAGREIDEIVVSGLIALQLGMVPGDVALDDPEVIVPAATHPDFRPFQDEFEDISLDVGGDD